MNLNKTTFLADPLNYSFSGFSSSGKRIIMIMLVISQIITQGVKTFFLHFHLFFYENCISIISQYKKNKKKNMSFTAKEISGSPSFTWSAKEEILNRKISRR